MKQTNRSTRAKTHAITSTSGQSVINPYESVDLDESTEPSPSRHLYNDDNPSSPPKPPGRRNVSANGEYRSQPDRNGKTRSAFESNAPSSTFEDELSPQDTNTFENSYFERDAFTAQRVMAENTGLH